ncbi:1-deoxy-D-xylulose-5-phosphate synthase [Clostridiales bacterium]|nr:1-deoxy-D-xylulose-5-phosphate synthase [Clostridiales bacterium]
MLEKINSPADLARLSEKEIQELAGEIRAELIRTVSENGGHLASNLGVVELTLAIHRVFHLPEDKVVFDVGHQSYVHKLITGRYSRFRTLREYGGISGFPKRDESEYDCFETGHASTSISAALGLARARDYRNEHHHVIALVGDGAMTGGMCYEALNDAGHSHTRLIVILNDNEMSIAPNVGALSSYLTDLRISAGWQSAKQRVRRLNRFPVFGKLIYRAMHGTKKLVKSMLLRSGDLGFFEALGFQYFGPINGHDLSSLEKTLKKAGECTGPCVIHVLTKKGYGYEQAEARPEAFHGTPPFYIESGNRIRKPDYPSAGHVMADTLAGMRSSDSRIVAITAAMKLGTGLDHFAEKYPDSVIDTGITEEHAATLAAGLAAGGMRPYYAVYSTFFQRCYDQMIHDVCMQNLPVVFLLDRSGLGGEDGRTHHGLFDLAEVLPVPGMTVLAPCDALELSEMIRWTLTQDGPCTIRYQKDGTPVPFCHPEGRHFVPGKWYTIFEGCDLMILAAGNMVQQAVSVRSLLEKEGVSAAVIQCTSLKPADEEFLSRISPDTPYFTLEEHMETGGFGAYISGLCRKKGFPQPADCIGVPDCWIEHGNHQLLMKDAGLCPDQIAGRILRKLGRAEQ